MTSPPRPEDEDERLAELKALDVLDTLPEETFDDVAELAATLCGVPIALVTFVDEDRQWFKACIGLDRREMDREVSLCGHAIVQPDQPLVVPDTLEDERFADNPLVTGPTGIRFYAGAPIVMPSGRALGTVCVLDEEPRKLTEDQIHGLETLADQVSMQLEDRRRELGLAERSEFLKGVLDSLDEHVAILDEQGKVLATNRAREATAAGTDGPVDPRPNALFATEATDDESAREIQAALEDLLDGGRSSFETEYRLDGPDDERWFRMRATAFPHRGHRRVVVTQRDVTQARQAAREREQLFHGLSERDAILENLSRALPQVLWIVEVDLSETVFQSPDAPAFWGVEPERLERDPLAWLSVVDERDQARVQGEIEEQLDRLRQDPKAAPELEFRIVHGETGQTRWIRLQGVGIVDGDELARIAGICEDITQRKRREAERERLASIVEAAPDGIGWAGSDGDVLYMNQGLQELLELPEDDDGTGREVREFLPESALEELRERKLPTARKEGYWTGESEVRTAQGETVPVLETIIAHEREGQEEYFSVIFRDIRPQKLAQRALEASEQRLRELAEHVDEAFWLVSPDLGEVHYVSPGFEELTGRSRQSVYEDPSQLLAFIHPEDRDRVNAQMEGLEQGSRTVRYRIQRPDGEVRRVETRAFPVLDEKGRMARIAGVSRDVTSEEEDRDRERRLARDRARTVELEQLVFATSHSLRTQVRRIRSFGQLLRQRAGDEPAPELEEPIGEMLAGSQELELLHDALREYAETTRGGRVSEPVDLTRVLREVLAERSAEIEAPGGRATVGEVPTVQGDPEQLRVLVGELVDNAIKFAGEEPPELHVEGRDRGQRVEIEFRDRGVGFDPAYTERIFGIFQQLEPHTTEGVGIGLTIARRIVENHGGEIRAEAEPGQGAKFLFTLPAAGAG